MLLLYQVLKLKNWTVSVSYRLYFVFSLIDCAGAPLGSVTVLVTLLFLVGVILISLALCADAVIGNVQEKAMVMYDAPNGEVVS